MIDLVLILFSGPLKKFQIRVFDLVAKWEGLVSQRGGHGSIPGSLPPTGNPYRKFTFEAFTSSPTLCTLLCLLETTSLPPKHLYYPNLCTLLCLLETTNLPPKHLYYPNLCTLLCLLETTNLLPKHLY